MLTFRITLIMVDCPIDPSKNALPYSYSRLDAKQAYRYLKVLLVYNLTPLLNCGSAENSQ
jgi:hypothetical protein